MGSVKSVQDSLSRAIEKLKEELESGFPDAMAGNLTIQGLFKVITDANLVGSSRPRIEPMSCAACHWGLGWLRGSWLLWDG
jgi:hypothetical protein